MKILITGGTGFIGLNLIEALLTRGDDVVSVALDDVPGDALATFAQLHGSLRSFKGDVRDTAFLKEVMKAEKVSAMFPLAAVTAGEGREAEFPEQVFEVNVVALIAQLRAARDAKVQRVIVPASGAVYGASYFDRAVVDEETTPCRPEDLYGISKFAAEKVALRLGQLWNLNLNVARIGGTFGPWERATGLRDLITPFFHLARCAALEGQAVLPTDIPAYCWVYSRDIASGLCHLLDAQSMRPGAFNISSGINWGAAIHAFAARLKERFPRFEWSESCNADEVTVPFTDTRDRARLNISKISATGWRPRYLPSAAFADYADWAVAHPGIFTV
jgi:nucleoside-diphosphate-sugar epimerase